MEPPTGSSNSTNPFRPSSSHPPRTTSATSAYQHDSSNRKPGDPLMRGHSDGDMHVGRPDGRSGTYTEPASIARETWMDIMRQQPSTRPDSVNRAELAANRAAIMASDRRRRLAENHEIYARRRSSSSLAYVPSGSNRPSQGIAGFNDDRSFVGSSVTSTSPFTQATQGTRERPLPRAPSLETLQPSRSREIALPRWQPDAEVSKCPICGNAFSMWYRRHHCRKCGRVVCASCSPHRITIPRQFIVHPPEDAIPSPTMPTTPGTGIISPTRDGDRLQRANPTARPQSSDYRIDPALGGGQEVRLCNPCVPDPNPLPHLPYTSSHVLPTLHHAPRPDRMSARHPSSTFGVEHSNNSQIPGLTRRGPSGRSEHRPYDAPRFDASLASSISRAAIRRHSHAPNPFNSQSSPPGYSSLYGSAPDHSGRQVRLNTLYIAKRS